jgi:hypothetical protein
MYPKHSAFTFGIIITEGNTDFWSSENLLKEGWHSHYEGHHPNDTSDNEKPVQRRHAVLSSQEYNGECLITQGRVNFTLFCKGLLFGGGICYTSHPCLNLLHGEKGWLQFLLRATFLAADSH